MLASLVALVGCESSPEKEAKAASAPVEVRVAPVRLGAIDQVLSATGQTAAASVLRVASPVAGRVTSLTAMPGDRLAANTVAARVLPTENEAALNGFSIVDRSLPLPSDERQTEQRLQRDLRGRDVPLRTPFDAVVSARLHNPGELVAANDVLMEVFDPRSLYVVAQVPQGRAAEMRPRLQVEIIGSTSNATGVVETVVPAVNAPSLTIPVRIAVTSQLEPALLDETVECRIITAHRADALLIPRSALISSNVAERGEIMVVQDSKAQRRSIEIGARNDADVEVTAGVTAGQVVIVDGQYGLPDGTEIRAAAGDQ